MARPPRYIFSSSTHAQEAPPKNYHVSTNASTQLCNFHVHMLAYSRTSMVKPPFRSRPVWWPSFMQGWRDPNQLSYLTTSWLPSHRMVIRLYFIRQKNLQEEARLWPRPCRKPRWLFRTLIVAVSLHDVSLVLFDRNYVFVLTAFRWIMLG